MARSVLCLAMLILGVGGLWSETPKPGLALKGLDPVELCQGKETSGLEGIQSAYGRFVYRFATKENQKTFLADPDRYAIQFGGACGRMGPFSGTGNSSRYWVHGERIYIFASESCRDGFKKNPEIHLDRANPVPKGTPEEKELGKQRIAKALEGFGGQEKVDAVRSLQRVEKLVYRQGDQETIGTSRRTWVYPNTLRLEDDFGTPYGRVIRGASGFEFQGKSHWDLDRPMGEEAWRRALRDPLVVLRNRNSPSFIALGRGQNQVEVALDGATTVWTLEEGTGRILKIAYQGRRSVIGNNEIVFSDFKNVSGLVLPHKRVEFFDGKEMKVPEVRLESLLVDGPIPEDRFLPPS